jgi:hypothetical protein
MLGYTQIASDCDINGFRFDYALISRRNVKRAGENRAVLLRICRHLYLLNRKPYYFYMIHYIIFTKNACLFASPNHE